MKDLVAAASTVRERAYAPYSGFRVGCALRTPSGAVFVGANVENAAYPQGLCAERSAVAAMVAAGEQRIVEVVVIGNGAEPCAPCGGCRQVLSEFAAVATPVHMLGVEGGSRTATLGELLPFAFGPLALGAAPAAPSGIAHRAGTRFGGILPKIAIILGEGLEAFADRLEAATAPEGDGLVAGTLAGVPVAMLAGRADGQEESSIVRTLGKLGVETLVLAHASLAINTGIRPGTVTLVTDHIDIHGANPPAGDSTGPGFRGSATVYDAGLRKRVAARAGSRGLDIACGVYLATADPHLRTPAELRAFRALGADLIGRSSVEPALSAHRAGLKVLGLAVVTAAASGPRDAPSSPAVMPAMDRPVAALDRLLTITLPEIAADAA